MESFTISSRKLASDSESLGESISAENLVALFNQTFAQSENTLLVGGADEPFYLPADGDNSARIFFRSDYVRSALHEIAHWSQAGEKRRACPDYGYWYAPDGRDAAQQAAFFSVEAKPQAIEKHFCDALNLPFKPSIDNLYLQIPESEIRAFEVRLETAYQHYAEHGLPGRAALFKRVLTTLHEARED